MSWAAGMWWAYSARAWCGFFASMADGRVVLRHELTWYNKPPEVARADIAALEKQYKIRLSYCVAQPQLWGKDPKSIGETISETFQAGGVPMLMGNDDRPNGWSRLRSWLAVRRFTYDDGRHFESPSLIIHPDCRYFIRTLPTLISDKKNQDDVSQTPDEFPASGARLYAMSRPMPPTKITIELPPGAIGHDVEELRRAARRR